MSVAVGIWSVVLKPGVPQVVTPEADIRITNVTLGAKLEDESGRTSVTLTYEKPVSMESDEEGDDEESAAAAATEKDDSMTTVLCSLTPGKIENALVDLVLDSDEQYLFELVGKNAICLSGNYIDQNANQVPFNDMEDSEDEEEGYRLEDISSDAEMDPADLEGDSDRFEEIAEEAIKSLKRPHDDAMETDTPKLSKADKKKKLKAEDGKAVPAGESISTTSETGKKSKKEKKAAAAAAAAEATEAPAEKKKATEKELPGGIKIIDVKVGSGPQAKKGSRVGMRYIGKLANGKQFDANTKGKPFSFRLGGGEVIKGWDEGLVGMQVGGERILTLPPKFGYGKRGTDGIPANSTLTFECKLVELK